MPDGAIIDEDFPDVVRKPRPVTRTDGQSDLVPSAPSDAEEFAPVVFENPSDAPPAPKASTRSRGRGRSGPSFVDRIERSKGAMERFDAKQMYAGQQAQKRELNSETQQTLRQQHVETERDFDTGQVEPVRDEEGNIQYRPGKGPVQYDENGKAIQTQYEPTGPKVVQLDKDAQIGPHPERPNEIYRQNKRAAWDYLGTVQEALASKDPAIKSAATDAQLGIDRRLHAAVSSDLGEEVNRRALLVRTKVDDFRGKTATLQNLNQQFENFDRDHPAVNETEGHFFTGGARPTKTAQTLREQKAALLKQIEDLQSKGYSTDPKKQNDFTKAEREALATTHRERSAWRAAHPKEAGDFDRLIQDRTATLTEQGEDPAADPVLSALDRRKKELGLGQPGMPEKDAQEQALRSDPAFGPLMVERDALQADHQKASDALTEVANEYTQRLDPVRQEIERGRAQIAPIQAQVSTYTARLESLLGMPEPVEGEDLDARKAEVSNRIVQLADPKLKGRVQAVLNVLEPAAMELRQAEAGLQPVIDAHDQIEQEARQRWDEQHAQFESELAPRRQDLQGRFDTAVGTREARIANQTAIALKTPILNHIADLLGVPPPVADGVTRPPSYRVNSVTGQLHIDPTHPAAALSMALKDGAITHEDYDTAIPSAMAIERAILAAEAGKAQRAHDAKIKASAPLDYRSGGGGTEDEISSEMLLTFYSDAVTAVDQIARSPISKFLFDTGNPNDKSYAKITKALHEHAQSTQALKDPQLQADWHVKAAGFLGAITPAMWSGGARAIEIPVLFSQGYQGTYDDASQFTDSEAVRVRSGIIGGLITSALSIVLGGAKANVGVPKTGFQGRLVEDGIDNAWKTGRVSGVLRYVDELKSFNLTPRDLAAIRPAVEKIRIELSTAPLTAVKNIAATALRDAAIGGGVQFAQNLSARQYDPDRPLGENVLESAATFGAFGATARSVGEVRTARAARRDLATFEQFAANTMRSRNPPGAPPIEPPEAGPGPTSPGGGPKPAPATSGPPDIRAVHSEIDNLVVPGRSPEENASTQTALRALVKISQGEPIETLTAEEKRAVLAKHENGLPRVEMVKGPDGTVPVILDGALERARTIAPITSQLFPRSEQEQRDKIFKITREPEASSETTPEAELPTFSVDVQNASGETTAVEVRAETAEAAHTQVAGQIPQGQGLIQGVTQISSPEKITPRNFVETAVHQIREQKGTDLTDSEDKSVRAIARVIQPHYDRWQQAFDAVEVTMASAESGGAALTRENALKISIPDIISHGELYTKTPEHAGNVVSEEAIHAVTAKLEDRDPTSGEARGPIDLVKIYRLLPEKLRTAMAGAYKAGGSDYNQAHEFWRMFMQGQLELARGGRIRLKGKFLQEQSSRPFVVENRKALARLMRYFRNMESELRRHGTSEDVIAEVNQASALIGEKIKEVDAHAQGLSESVAASETKAAPTPRSEPPARAPPSPPAPAPAKPDAGGDRGKVVGPGGNQGPLEQHPTVSSETEASRGANEPTAGTQLAPEAKSHLAQGLNLPAQAVGHSTRVTSNGRTLNVAYVAQEVDQARPSHDEQGRPTPGYDQSLQPRDRALPAYRKQAHNIATSLEFGKAAFFPDTTTPATTPDLGAPIMTQGGDTLIGNGREIAIRLAYSQNLPSAAKYREDFIRNARGFGIDPATVRDMKQPVLKRVILDKGSKEDLIRFSQESNEGAAMSSNAIEVAGRDATRLTPQLLSLFDPNYALDSTKNKPFLRSYVRDVIRGETANEANLTGSELERRVRSAIFSYAYGTDQAGRAALDRLSGDEADAGGKTITNGLLTVAPIVARMKTDIATGDLFPLDISPAISRGAQDISETIRNKPVKQSTATALTDMRNQAALLESDPLEKAVIDFLLDNRGSRQAIELGLSNYVEAVFKLGNPKNAELFGDRAIPSPLELFRRATSSAALRGELSSQAIIEGVTLSPDQRLDALYEQHGHDAVEDALSEYWDEMGEMLSPKETVSAEKAAKQSGEVLTPEKAHERWDDWRRQLDAIGKERGSENGGKIILSLFDRSGIWAEPFLRAGYDVRKIDLQIDKVDVMDIDQQWLTDYDMTEVHGVLAANPCTDFAGSGARWWKDKDEDGRTEVSVKLAKHTMAIIEYLKPSFWALENPVGRLDELTGIGKPRLQFHPHNYGDPYTKRTQIWGNFNAELPLANVEPTEGSKIHKLRGDIPEQKDERSKTPEGFALAFAVANSNHGPAERVSQILEAGSGVARLQPGEEQGTLPTGPVKSEAQLAAEQRERARALLRLQKEQDLRLRAAKRLAAADLTLPERDMFAPPPKQGELFSQQTESKPWPADFPDVTIHTNINTLRKVPDYKLAKSGDALAAYQVVDRLVKPERILDLAKRFPGAIVVAVHSEEQAGRNQIPLAYAYKFEELANMEVDSDIVQSNRTFHTDSGAVDRFLSRPFFDGPVQKGRDYIVLDDVTTSGSTLAGLRAYIESNGGNVVAATSLATTSSPTAGYGGHLALQPHVVAVLDKKFGIKALDALLLQYGTASGALTNSQGRYLASFGSLEAIRDKLAAYQQEIGVGEASGLQPEDKSYDVGEIKAGAELVQGSLLELPPLDYDIADIRRLQEALENGKGKRSDRLAARSHRDQLLRQLQTLAGMEEDGAPVRWEDSAEHAAVFALADDPKLTWAQALAAGRKLREVNIENRIFDNEPVPVEAVRALNTDLPAGYRMEGDQYIYDPTWDSHPEEFAQAEKYVEGIGVPLDEVKKAADGIARTLSLVSDKDLASSYESNSALLRDLGRPPVAPRSPEASAKAVATRRENARQREVASHRAGLSALEQGDTEAVNRAFEENKNRVSTIIPRLVKGEPRTPVWNIVGSKIETPADMMMAAQMIRSPYVEMLKVAVLDRTNRVLGSEIVSIGSLNESIAHPREIFRLAVLFQQEYKDVRVIISHNHPSGDPSPSQSDHSLTRRLQEVADMFKIKLLDHVITNGKKFYSFTSGSVDELPERQMQPWEVAPGEDQPKLDSPEQVAKYAAVLRSGDPDATHVFYLSTRYNLKAVERIPPIDPSVSQGSALSRLIMRGASREGAYAVILDLPASQSSPNLLIRRLSENVGETYQVKVLDAMWPGMNSAREAGLLEEPPEYAPIRKAVENMPDRMRDAVAGLVAGNTFAEIGESTGASRYGVARLANEALKRVREGLGEDAKPIGIREAVTSDGKQPKLYSKSSTQVSLSKEQAQPFKEFIKSIPADELYTDPEDPTFGREDEPHITLLYGITQAAPSDTAKALLALSSGKIGVTVGKLSLFKTKKYNVLKAEIESPDLHELNNELQKKVPFETDYPVYQPHLTIAYLKKGEGAKYVGDARFEGARLEFGTVDFRSKDGKKYSIDLNAASPRPAVAQLTVLENVVRTELKAQETNDPLKELMAVLETDVLSDLYRKAEKQPSGKFEIGRPDLALGAEGASIRAAHQFHTDTFQAETIEGWDKVAEEHLSNPDWSRQFSQNIIRRYLSGDNLTAWETRAAMRLIAAESHTIGTPDEKLGHAVRAFAYARLRSKAGQELASGRDPFKTPEERGREFLSKTFFRLTPEKEAEIEAEPDANKRQERLSAAMRERIDQLEKAFSYLAGKGITLDDIFNGSWELHGKGKKIIENEMAGFDVPRQHALRLAQTGIRSAADIAKATGLSIAEVERVNDQFLDQLEKTLTAKVAAGLTLENIDLQEALFAQPTEPGPAANAAVKSPEEVRAEVRRIIRGMGFVPSKDLGKFKIQKKKKPKLFVPPKPAGAVAPGPEKVPFTGRVPDDSPVPYEPRRQNKLAFKPGDELRNVDRPPNEQAEVPRPENQPAPYTGRVLGQTGLPLYQEMMIRKGADMGSADDLIKIGRVAQSMDAKPFDMVYEAWINNIFSGLGTHAANLSGNTISMAMDFTVRRGLESLLNTVYRDSDSPTFAEFKYIAQGILPGLVNGIKRGVRAWDTESTVFSRDVMNEQIDLLDALDKAGGVAPAIPGATGRIIRIPVRALLFEDEVFKNLIGQMEVGAQAYRIAKKEGLSGEKMTARMNELVSTQGSEAWARAVEKAIYLTYQEPTGLTSLFRDQGKSAALGKMAEKAKVEGRKRTAQVLRTEEMVVKNLYRAAGFFFPVVRTTYNIFKIGVSMANVGPTFSTIPYRLARAGFYKWKDGKPFVESYSKARQIHDFAQQLMAWTTFALLWSVTTGDEDDDKKPILFTGSMPYTLTKKGEREMNERAYGGTYMLRIGGRDGIYIPYGRIEPIATVLGTVIDTITNIKKVKHGQTLAQTGDALLGYFLAQAQSKTFLSGFGDLTKALEGSRSWTDVPKKLLLQALVPNLIRQPLRALDEWVRDSKTASPLYQTLPAGGMAEPKINPYGQPVEKGGNPFTRLFVAAGIKPDAELQKADRLLINWNRTHPSESWAPGTPLAIYQDAAGKTHQMTAVESRKFLETSGKLAAERLRGQVSEVQIANPTEEDVKRIRNIFEEAHAQVKREMFPKNRVNLVKAWQKAA